MISWVIFGAPENQKQISAQAGSHCSWMIVQCAWKDESAKFELVRILLADSTAVARQLIHSKLSSRKTACLDLTSGPQPLQGTGKHR
jgi:hypothetical protein